VTRREPLDAPDAEVLARNVLEREIGVESGGIELAAEARDLEQRPELGGEGEAPAAKHHVVERLLADAVACEDEPLAHPVPDGDREHASERRREVGPALLVDVGNHRGVAGPRHVVAAGGQVAPKVVEVVELAVEHGDDVLRLVRHGLLAGLEIDDAEPPMPEHAPPQDRDAARVGPAVDERPRHARHDVRVGRSGGRY
jgi:hypothetical protein